MILSDARLKVKRANDHIDNIKVRIELLHTTDSSRVDINPETGGEILTHSFSDIHAFDAIALMIGDAVHNLNCALDYIWLQTIEKLIPRLVDDRAKFPVRNTLNELKGFLTKTEVDVSCPDLFNLMVRTIQPCDGGNEAIWPIHVFDIRDKHRLLIPVLTSGEIDGIRVIDQNGEVWPGSGSSAQMQLPPYIIPFEKGLHVKDKGKLTASVGVKEENSGCFMHVPETLSHYSYIIDRVIVLFEDFLKSKIGG